MKLLLASKLAQVGEMPESAGVDGKVWRGKSLSVVALASCAH